MGLFRTACFHLHPDTNAEENYILNDVCIPLHETFCTAMFSNMSLEGHMSGPVVMPDNNEVIIGLVLS
jgi:hypothetical protein